MTLAHRYPRYEARLQEAARDEREMIDYYIMDDGGTIEGPAYWNYTFSHALITVALLARHEKKTLAEYAWDKLKQTGDFALAILSDAKDGTYTLPLNDAHCSRYNLSVCSVYKEISENDRWKILHKCAMEDAEKTGVDLATMLLSGDVENVEGEIHSDGFSSLNTIGHTSLRRTTEDVGRVHFYITGGPGFFAHCHGDKGQIILEVDGNPLLIDRGVCTYSNPAVNVMQKAQMHNLFIPEPPEGMKAFEQDIYAPGAKVVRDAYENGVFDYCTDVLEAWEQGIFKSVTRSVKSEDPHVYYIYDDAEFMEELSSSFNLHTYGEIAQQENCWIITDGEYQLVVMPQNYTPEKAIFGENSIDCELRTVNSLKLYLSKEKEQHIITKLEVHRKEK